ncbi:hypothetical protein GOP47_0017958 [Adiantum capillus-veneris]|uniref:Uncharacterized protein n=1 Tax=Adiantum capillus-veneris TaxID=13818 RepID=A0A9D4UGF8_ADICA|nr:hypothetical protein GOP47_0017958 [Adiantum capillus-veneris]
MNFMNTHALVSSHLRDELVNCAKICSSDHEDYLRALPENDQKLIDTLRKITTKGEEPWHPLTRRYLARLLFDVQMSKELHTKLESKKTLLSKEDLKKEETKIMNDLYHKYSDRVGKILNIETISFKGG